MQTLYVEFDPALPRSVLCIPRVMHPVILSKALLLFTTYTYVY